MVKLLKVFAKEVGASQDKIILLVEDGAGWHRSDRVELPSGIVTEILPAYSPELQAAERLWSLVDEPLINTYFDTLDEGDINREMLLPAFRKWLKKSVI